MFILPALIYYVQFLTPEQAANTCGFYGYLLELAVKDFFGKPLVISPTGKRDISFIHDGKRRYMEIKENGGDFINQCKGSSLIAYSVFIDINKPLNEQFGYVMPLSAFKECGYKLNHIRKEKVDKDGYNKMSLQTLYNYSKADFHGAKAFKLSALWEESGAVTFKEFFHK